jgi:REP element-mobilizing transposase RayT
VSEAHHRRSIRLPDYAYDDGVYFVTICAHERESIFGIIVGDEMRLNPYGEIVRDEWLQTANLRSNVELDAFVVMPNHMHGIIGIHANAGTHGNAAIIENTGTHGNVGAQRAAPSHNVPAGSLGAVVRSYKSAVARRINLLRETPGAPVWQRNYHEHVIRDEKGLNKLREYIQHNPALWAEDQENPEKR